MIYLFLYIFKEKLRKIKIEGYLFVFFRKIFLKFEKLIIIFRLCDYEIRG